MRVGGNVPGDESGDSGEEDDVDDSEVTAPEVKESAQDTPCANAL